MSKYFPAILVSFLLPLMANPSIAQCGREGQRPCNAWERLPSCDSGLIEKNGRCEKKELQCGGAHQRPCQAWERVPSCNEGLVEDFTKNECAEPEPTCGKENQRPCKITERVPSCGAGLIEDFAQGRCVGPESVSKVELDRLGDEIYLKYRNELDQLKPLLEQLAHRAQRIKSSGDFDRLLNEQNYAEIERLLEVDRFRQELRALRAGQISSLPSGDGADKNFFELINSISIGFAADASALAGILWEWGIVFTVNDQVSRQGAWEYMTYGYKAGVATGASAGVSVSAWLYEPSKLCGSSQAFAVGAGYFAGLVLAGWVPTFEEWGLYTRTTDVPLYGISVVVAAAVEVDIAMLRTLTIVKRFGRQDCSPCGTRGIRPCTVYERVPSCGPGLIEKWGRCLMPDDGVPVPMTKLQ